MNRRKIYRCMSVKAHAQRRVLKMAERAAMLSRPEWERVYAHRVHHEGLRMERMDAKMDEITNSPPPAEKEPTSVIDVQFSMYCHNARCIMLGVTQERFGAVNTDTGHGQADDEECDECGEAMYYYPYDRSR